MSFVVARSTVSALIVVSDDFVLLCTRACLSYTYQAGEPTCYDVPFEVLRRQLDILVDSPYADPVTDQVLRT